MKFIRLQDASYPQWDKLWDIYLSSFPHYERRNFEKNLEKMAHDEQFYFCAIESFEGVLVGILCYWKWSNLCFVEHLAVDPEIRGAGLGARILSSLAQQLPDTVILLEIDPPMDEMSIRRKQFYLRNGYKTNDYLHIHPSFETPHHPHRLVVMSHPRELTPVEFDRFREYTFARILP